MAGGADDKNLQFTPTWIVAVVCTVIVAISLAVERLIHHAGHELQRKNKKPLYEALQKIKEELMLLGFISLLLTVSQDRIVKICIPHSLTRDMLPCKMEGGVHKIAHFQGFLSFSASRHLLDDEKHDDKPPPPKLSYCASKGKEPLISATALHHLHIFIFVLAVVHVSFCVLTMFFGGAKISQWKNWEESIAKEADKSEAAKVIDVHEHAFVKGRFLGFGKDSTILIWVSSFFKQFYGSVTKSDYATLRLGFIMTHCKNNPKFNFHKYMIRTLEDDFTKVVGISWYLWLFVIVFLLLNVDGWHTYFWIAFVPLILLLAVGTKLEHVIAQLAREVAEKHTAIEGDLIIKPSDEHFWFSKPQFVLFLIHFILFQNAFEIAFFFWILFTYGFNSCIMGQVRYIIPRLVIGVFIQILCSYSTMPLYAIVSQMGSNFKKTIFDDHVHAGLLGWAQKVKKKKRESQSDGGSPRGVQLGSLFKKAAKAEESATKPSKPEDSSTKPSKPEDSSTKPSDSEPKDWPSKPDDSPPAP